MRPFPIRLLTARVFSSYPLLTGHSRSQNWQFPDAATADAAYQPARVFSLSPLPPGIFSIPRCFPDLSFLFSFGIQSASSTRVFSGRLRLLCLPALLWLPAGQQRLFKSRSASRTCGWTSRRGLDLVFVGTGASREFVLFTCFSCGRGPPSCPGSWIWN